MTLLQFILILSSFIFIIFALDAYQRKKLNFLHFFVFIWWTAVILVFSFNIKLLNDFWAFFGIARGADLLVYVSIILLFYFYFELLNKINKIISFQSKMLWNMAISEFNIDKLEISENKDFKDEILFLIRAYNEASMIGNVIDEVFNAWYSKILVVNDGSKDDTKSVVKQKQQQYKDKTLLFISHFTNRGWWAANKTWFEFLKKYWKDLNVWWVATFDADGQMDTSDMSKFIQAAQTWKYDVLLGSRFVQWWTAQNIPTMRRIILFGSKIVTYVFNSIWVSDPHNGYKMLNLKALSQINIDSDGFTYASELLDEIHRLKLRFTEIPVTVRYTEYSLSKWQKNSNAINILLELIYTKLFKK